MEAQIVELLFNFWSECLNITVSKYSGVVFIADNDVIARGAEDVCAKIYDKKKTES